MKILFYYPTSCSTEPEPTGGIGILIAIARELGHEIEFYDYDHHRKLFNFEDIFKEFNPDVFAVSCMTPQYYFAQQAISFAKEKSPSCITIIGGPHASALPVETLQEINGLDFLCEGEGEKTFKDFLNYLEQGQNSSPDISGLYYKKNGKIIVPKPQTLLTSAELDNLPMAAWDVIFKHGPYKQKVNYTEDAVPVFSVITARGCPYECTFCDEKSIWKRKIRERSIENVIKEIQYLVQNYKAEHFNILDDTFTMKAERVKEFCSKVKALNISYRITAKVNTVNSEMLEALAGSGCKLVAYGVESGDENVLKIMKKHQSLDSVRKAFELTNNAGMTSYALCMVGNIGEDFEAVKKTAQFVKDINATLFSAAIMTPYPGSENYKICEQNNWIITKDWSKWCPSPIRLKNWEPVARTDKMDKELMLKSYYYLNNRFMYIRFRRRYGTFYLLNPNFYRTEILKRLQGIGLTAFLKHIIQLIKVSFSNNSTKQES
ncbi:MAG: radical SAM protein [Candidatus Schekmanbacteria bacterium]|nr:radical SAM protein [Candidatus Schekmanbacteria bacterium]